MSIANIDIKDNKIIKEDDFLNIGDFVVPNFIGNISDSEWNKLIVTETGRPARTAQDLFAEIVSWYKLNKKGRRKRKNN